MDIAAFLSQVLRPLSTDSGEPQFEEEKWAYEKLKLWYIEGRLGVRILGLQIFFRFLHWPNCKIEELEFWIVKEKDLPLLKGKIPSVVNAILTDIGSVVEIDSFRFKHSYAFRWILFSDKRFESNLGTPKSKTRFVSALLLIGLFVGVYLVWLSGKPWGIKHISLLQKCYIIALAIFAVGFSRTVAFWTTKTLGFVIALLWAAGFSRHFGWTISGIGLSRFLVVAAVLLVCYSVLPIIFTIPLWLVAMFIGAQPISLISGDWAKEFHGDRILACLVTGMEIVVSAVLFYLGWKFYKRQQRLNARNKIKTNLNLSRKS